MKKAVCNTMKFLLSALVPVLMIVMFYYVITWLNETGKWEFNITLLRMQYPVYALLGVLYAGVALRRCSGAAMAADITAILIVLLLLLDQFVLDIFPIRIFKGVTGTLDGVDICAILAGVYLVHKVRCLFALRKNKPIQ